MAHKKTGGSIFESKGWKNGMKYLYGWGAAVVIIGALFKILHWKGAEEMLIVGLGTESVIFFFSAFEPLPGDEAHYQWERVYPILNPNLDLPQVELDEEKLIEQYQRNSDQQQIAKPSFDGKLPNIEPELLNSLAGSLKGLKDNVTKLNEISDATVATNDFSSKVKDAASKIDQISKGYTTTVESMNELSKTSLDSMAKLSKATEETMTGLNASLSETQSYQDQMKKCTTNLQSLNALYEAELLDAQNHIKSVNKFYGNLANVMNNLADASTESETLRGEVGKLAKNMGSLNTVYGNMLAAMRA